MTDFPIDPSTRRSGPYTATAGQTVFDYDFPVLDADDLGVYELPNGGTAETRLTRGTDYTVAGVGLEAGGSIVLTAGAAAGDRISIVGERTPRRSTDFNEAGAFTANALNLELDALTIVLQEAAAKAGRTLRLADGDADADLRLPVLAQRLGRFLRFDPLTGAPVAFDIATLDAVALPLSIAQGGTGGTTPAAARAALSAEDAALNHAYLDVVQAFTRAQRYAPTTLTDGATIAWDLDLGPLARVTLAGNRTMGAPANRRDGGCFILIVTQDGTGGRTLAWNAAFDFGIEGTPVLPTGANKVAIFTFISNGASMFCIGRWNN